ncbi:MAG: type II secretion system F family protein [Kiritimatiellae bacterium]|nr:type II secretion system F family protein [Kiritimatiellia bacterium]
MLSIAMYVAWAAAAAGLAWHVAAAAAEVTYVTLADGRRQARALPVLFKILLPFVGNLDALVSRPAFERRIAESERTLVSAGMEGLLSGREFVALEILCPVVTGAAWCAAVLSLGAMMPESVFASSGLAICAFGVAVCALMPGMWLKGELKRRHAAIMKALPFVLDLLTLSVEAGMDFISALQRNCQTRRMDALNEELLRMVHEIQLGASRRDALRAMADRVGQADLRSLALALVQADEFGVSIGAILRIQSDQLRSRRFDRAEKLAAEAPTKMLGPLMLCIFPAVFVILLGPVLIQAIDGML